MLLGHGGKLGGELDADDAVEIPVIGVEKNPAFAAAKINKTVILKRFWQVIYDLSKCTFRRGFVIRAFFLVLAANK